jgi:acyl carrier protein
MEPALQAHLERRTSVLARIRAALIEALDLRLEPDEIDPDAALFGSGLRLDSIDALELVVAIETEFGVSIAEGDATSPHVLRTLNTLADRIVEALP